MKNCNLKNNRLSFFSFNILYCKGRIGWEWSILWKNGVQIASSLVFKVVLVWLSRSCCNNYNIFCLFYFRN